MINSNTLRIKYHTSNIEPFPIKNTPYKKPSASHPTTTSFSTIDPMWHLIASLQTIVAPKITTKKQEALYNISEYNRSIERQFMNHCALLIQKNFRGYMQRKYYQKFLPIYRRVRSLLEAMIAGWRVRRIMKLKRISKKVKEIKQLDNNKEDKKMRILKRDLAYEIRQLQKKGQWLQVFHTQKCHNTEKPLKNSKIIKQINLKAVFHPKQSSSKVVSKTIKQQKIVVEKHQNNNSERLQMHENEERNIIIEVSREIQKPIIARGYYQFSQENMGQDKQDNKSQTRKVKQINKKKIGSQKNGNNNDKKIENQKDKSKNKSKQNTNKINSQQQPPHKNSNQKQVQILKFDSSILSIHLPIEEQFCLEQPITKNPIIHPNHPNQARQVQPIKINSSSITQKNNKKNSIKGLKVTLRQSRQQNQEQNKQQNIQKFPTNRMDEKYTPNKSKYEKLYEENSAFLSKHNITQKQIERYGPETTIRELLEAYNGPYHKKKQQVYEKLIKIHTQQKFIKANQ